MEIQKLFQILVVGGAVLSSGAIANNHTTSTQLAMQELNDDKPAPIFCTDEDACVVDACSGKKTVKEGFFCCWGTSCEE